MPTAFLFADIKETEIKNIITFSDLDLTPPILRSLAKMGLHTPTPIQEKAITPIMQKRDVLALAPTGTGKTCAFGIPAIEGIRPDVQNIQCVVLCPTRELALQTAVVLKQLSATKEGVRVTSLYGGEPIARQIAVLRRRPQVIVATPGRMLDHIKRRTVRLDNVNMLVLDEADRMLDMGFRDDINAILSRIPQARQTVMFSATMSKDIRDIAEKYQKDACEIKVEQETRAVNTVTQFYTEIGTRNKTAALLNLLNEKKFGKALVFVGTKVMADTLTQQLLQIGVKALALHGNLNQRQRDSVMQKYRFGQINILVATDVASRGIDVNNIEAVINYDIPQDSDSYVHRIGRTGRANHTGAAYTFIYIKERCKLRQIISATGININPFVIKDAFGSDKPFAADSRRPKRAFSDSAQKQKQKGRAREHFGSKAVAGAY